MVPRSLHRREDPELYLALSPPHLRQSACDGRGRSADSPWVSGSQEHRYDDAVRSSSGRRWRGGSTAPGQANQYRY